MLEYGLYVTRLQLAEMLPFFVRNVWNYDVSYTPSFKLRIVEFAERSGNGRDERKHRLSKKLVHD